MSGSGHRCAFCNATTDIVSVSVLDQKWCKRFGGEPVIALDHGWYTNTLGERTAADRVDAAKFFGPHVRAVCDYCAHGWMEDVRWRAEPVLLSLAEGRPTPVPARQWTELTRWAALTAMLAERVDGMPLASSSQQRDSVRRGAAPDPHIASWFFVMRQRLPARVHLSQVPVPPGPDGDAGLVQVVSVDLAHLSVLVVLPSDSAARGIVEGSALAASLGGPAALELTTSTRALDLSRTPHPHHVAVQRLCSTTLAAGC